MFVDTKMLVNARIRQAPHHETAWAGLELARRGAEPLRISRQVMCGYLAVVIHLYAWPTTLTREAILEDIRHLNRGSRCVRMAQESPRC